MRRGLTAAITAAAVVTITGQAAAAGPDAGRAWRPEPATVERYASVAPGAGRMEQIHRVTAADGVEISVETYLPARKDGGPEPPARVPTILVSTPYAGAADTAVGLTLGGGNNDTALNRSVAERFNARGYAVAIMHWRGTGVSGGCSDLFGPQSVEDTTRVIEWLAGAPWSSGRVGMFGGSASATAAIAVAGLGDRRRVRSLRAIVPVGALTSHYAFNSFDGVSFANGAVQPAGYNGLFAIPRDDERDPRHVLERPGCVPANLPNADQSGDFNAWFREREYRRGARRIRAATLYLQGLIDTNVPPSMAVGFSDRLPRTTPYAALIGQWVHADSTSARKDFWDVATAWYDEFLLGHDTGTRRWPKVQIQDASGQWRTERRWPRSPGAARQVALTGPSYDVLPLSVAVDLHDTGGPEGTTGGPEGTTGTTFTVGPLEEPLRITGQPVLDLWVKTTRPAANLSATMQVEGTRQIVMGARSLRHLDPIVAGRFEQARGADAPTDTAIRVPLRLEPTELVVPAGGTITVRVAAAGATSPALSLLPAADAPVVTILHDCPHVSVLRFVTPEPDSELLNVWDREASSDALTDDPGRVGTADGGGIGSGPICGRAPVRPEIAISTR